MSFELPNFNLVCNIYTVTLGANSFRLDSPCNLAMGKRNALFIGTIVAEDSASNLGGFTGQLLLPPGTDIRDQSCGGFADLVEVPAGSGRFYGVSCVDDIGKGFDNEHRFATILKTWGFTGNRYGLTDPWPTPIP